MGEITRWINGKAVDIAAIVLDCPGSTVKLSWMSVWGGFTSIELYVIGRAVDSIEQVSDIISLEH